MLVVGGELRWVVKGKSGLMEDGGGVWKGVQFTIWVPSAFSCYNLTGTFSLSFSYWAVEV